MASRDHIVDLHLLRAGLHGPTTTVERARRQTCWIHPLIGLALAGLVTLILLRSTANSMVTIWYGSITYSYGFVVVPNCAFLVWRLQKATHDRASGDFALWPGVDACFARSSGRSAIVADVQLTSARLHRFADALVWTFLGSAATRTLRFPLLFLFCHRPGGKSLVGPLQRFTAVFTVNAVRWSGIPAVQDGLL